MKKRIIAIVAVFAVSLCGFALAACSDSAEKYAVTYNANGGYFVDIGTSLCYEKVEKGGYAKGEKTPAHPDSALEFKGWGLSSDSKTAIKLNAYPITGDTEFFAIWFKDEPTAQHTVTFYYNYEGASPSVFTTKSADDGTAVEAPSPAPSRGEAYTFDGWFTQAEGGLPYNFSAGVTANLSLYAHWTEVTVDPAIIAIQVYQKPTKTEYVKGQTFGTAGLVVRALYSGGKNPASLAAADYTVSTPDMTKLGEQTVTVSYDNDGTILTDEFTINIVEKAVTSLEIGGDLKNKRQEVGAPFDPAGLTFTAIYNDGDSKRLDVSEIAFASTLLNANGAFEAEGEAQITATYDGVTSETKAYVTVYTPEETKYNVEFDKNNTAYANGITGMPATQRVVENTMAKQPTAPKLKGFAFGGWHTDAACTTAFDFARAITDNIRLYAKWEAIEYVVDYKLGGGTNDADNKATYAANASGVFETVSLEDPSKGHNEFGGWFFDKEYETSATELSYDNVTEYAVKDGNTYTVTLYAKFTPEVYNIVYEWGAANNIDYKAEFVDGYAAPAKYTYGVGVKLPDADDVKITVLKAGEAVEFNFLGWYLKSDATKTHINSVSSTLYDNKTVVADIVQSAAYNVTYDYNYTGSAATVKKVIKDGHATAMSPAPTRAGYTFDKWYTTKEGGAEFDFANTPITQNTTVYAGWTPIEYTVSYIGLPAGTTNGNAAKYTVESGENGTVTLEDPTDLPEGYRFFGWYGDNKYKTEKAVIVPADIASADEKVITVYAKCNNLYTVMFNENITEAAVTDMPADIEDVTYGDGIERPTKTPSCANYTFGGWYVDKECTTEWIFTDGEGTATLVKPTADNNYKCEVYVKWIENPESGVYLFGTPNGSDIHHADIADYKAEVTEEGGVKTYAIGNLDLEVGTSFKLINYTQSTGDITWIAAATTVVVHPQAGMTVSKTSDGNYKVGAVSIEDATWTLVVSNGRADFTLEIEGGYIGLRAPTAESYEELAYAEMPASDDRAFIAGNFTDDFKLYKEWSNDSALIITAKVEKDDNTYYVFQGVKLNKYDEYKIVLGNAQSSVQYVATSGTYNIVYNATANTVAVYASKELTATFTGVVYEGKTPTAANFTVEYDGAALADTDYIVIADAAVAGENTATVVYLGGGVIKPVAYTATADAINKVEITTKPATLGYYVGDALDFTDIVLKVIYNSGDELIASWTGNNDLDGNARITLEIAEEYYADGGFVKAGADIPVTVKFDGVEAATNVEINVYNKLTSIVITDPATTEYVSGVSEELDYAGLVVTAYYNNTAEADGDNAVKAIVSLKSDGDENGYTIDATAYVYDATGDYDITVSLTEVFGTLTSTASGKFTVGVVAPKVVSVAATDDSALAKTTQLIGSAFDASGLRFVGTKNDKDGTEVEIAAVDMKFEITVGGEIAANEAGLLVKSGAATVTATYTVDGEELNATFETAVAFEIADRLTSIAATQPDKTSFPQNGAFDKTGMTVTAKYNENIEGATEKSETIVLENCTVTADLAAVGESTGVITVSYTENGVTVTNTVNVEVTEPKVVSVTVTNISTLTKKKYYVGDTFAPAGLKFKATYDNGTVKADVGAAAFTFNGGNAFATASATANSTVVSIVYTADETVVVTGTVTVTVYNKLTSIVLTAQPTAPHTAGWVAGDPTATLDSVAVTAYYNNTTAEDGENAISKDVTATTDAATVNMSTAGTKTITATYSEAGVGEQLQSAQCTIEIEVIAKAMVALDYEGDVIEQYKNRAFDPDGLTFVKVYNNDARENIVGTTGITFTATNNWIVGGTFRKSGENAPVSANYTEDGADFTVALRNVTVVDNTEYKVTYVGNNGDYAATVPKADYYQFESTIATPAVPVCYGFAFAGWYTDAACTAAWIFDDDIPVGGEATQVLEDTTLYAKWTPNKYIISMEDENGESVGDPFNYTATDNVFTPRTLAVPTTTKPGHSFKGWTYYDLADPTEENIFTELTQARLLPEYSSKSGSAYSIVLKPVYEKAKFTVTFDSNGGSAIADQSVEYRGNASEPSTDPTKTHYAFAGWYTTAALETAFDFANTEITEATTIYAKWTAVDYDVTYSFKDENGVGIEGAEGDNPATYNADRGKVALKPATTTAYGMVFIQWQNADGDKVTELSTSLVKDGKIELTAVFGEATVHTVSFDGNGGSAVADQYVTDGENATKPADPTYVGYRLAYWYLDDENEAFDFENTPITDDITLTAKWTIKNYTVAFDSDGGTSVAPLTVQEGTFATKPADPTKAASTFLGWFHGNEPTAFDFEGTVISGDIELTAKWDVAEYAVKFDLNGVAATAIPQQDVKHGEKVQKPADPTDEDNQFIGWYTDAACSDEKVWSFDTGVTEEMTLYAKWMALTDKFMFVNGTTQKRMYDNSANNTDATVKKEYTLMGIELAKDDELTFKTKTGETFTTIAFTFNPASKGVTGGSNVITTKGEGSFDIYLKLLNNNTWEVYAKGDALLYGEYYVVGTMSGWSTNADYLFNNADGSITINVVAKTKFKIVTDGTWLGYYFKDTTNSRIKAGAELLDAPDGDDNIVIKNSGKYKLVFDGEYLSITRVGNYEESTVTFDAQGGTFVGGPATPVTRQTVNGKITETQLPTVQRDGFVFKGWFTAENGEGTSVTDAMFTSDATVYAKWLEEGAEEQLTPGQYIKIGETFTLLTAGIPNTSENETEYYTVKFKLEEKTTITLWTQTADGGSERTMNELIINGTAYISYQLKNYSSHYDLEAGSYTVYYKVYTDWVKLDMKKTVVLGDAETVDVPSSAKAVTISFADGDVTIYLKSNATTWVTDLSKYCLYMWNSDNGYSAAAYFGDWPNNSTKNNCRMKESMTIANSGATVEGAGFIILNYSDLSKAWNGDLGGMVGGNTYVVTLSNGDVKPIVANIVG